MIRNLKLLSLALASLLALSAAMAATALAVPQFTASAYPATGTGENTSGTEVFTTEGGKVECDSHFVSHSLSGASSTLTVTPTYTNCSAFGFLSATVNTEGCSYVLHVKEKVAAEEYASTTDIVCPAGKSIKVTASTCKMEIKPQTGLWKWLIKVVQKYGPPVWRFVKRHAIRIADLIYHIISDGFLCPFGGTGAKSDGQYNGEFDMERIGGGDFLVSGS